MEKPGMVVSRWFDGVLEKNQFVDQPSNLKAVMYWGHAPNSQTRLPDMVAAMKQLDTLVVIDPYPTMTAAMHGRTDGVYLLPAATQFETQGSVTASNRSIQWRERVIQPLFESKTDHEIMYLFAKKFGFAEQLCKNIKVVNNEPVIEDILREINRTCWTIGYSGGSPERIKLHAANKHTFDPTTLKAESGPCAGDYYGLPWPCWGTPEMKHPGTPILYNIDKPVMEGGMPFRANWGVDHNGESLLAADGSATKDSELDTGYPEFDHVFLKKLGWWSDLTPAEQLQAEGKNWKTDALGRHHPGGDGARLRALRQRPRALQCVEFPRSGSGPPRTAAVAAPRPGGAVPDLRGQGQFLARADPVQIGAGGRLLERLSADHDLGPPGRVRGRRRRNPLQSLAGRVAAGYVHRDQSAGCEKCRRRHRPLHSRRNADRRAPESQSAGDPARAARAWCGCLSTSAAGGWAKIC